MDGVTILNEIEVVRVVNETFNSTAGCIALIVTVLICAIAGFFTGRLDCSELLSTLTGGMIGIILGLIFMAVFGTMFRYPPETVTIMQYEVTVDDSVSLTDFYEHYNIIEQRGDIFVVEEKE